ncbi:nicotinamide riboside transporter PnuC [Paenibacillus mucilaginosus]|uniref:Nicotinamide mononucleotide transporter PnuC n=1 Tax=Paenibacillus mucilaginosus (strain KNP414) TaxID=1036673 RepID=F8FIP3_PAEMK|nr:nicotinamide riboside transporter PnuC [Paenibacillus mucilaginosus]AEI45497.1 nicotinamide mononucleotide transporter PnuC [Paenibacillus mucilaginosus KNP414]MCG7215253.1 nicotinamide riboside transporter PnuC [Paenibacillus mucilaginosus]WDM26921.1 nicotinamide riboside transporter PnuC [Paenibacillus mucilaginosus]WFA21633.1 nicotinamide riboside transporter PnuC [Paenibacillus mucilaginosus]
MNRTWEWVLLILGAAGFAAATSSSLLEGAATATGLMSVWLTARQNLWCWPVSLVNVICFFFLFRDAKLYADMSLQLLYFVLSIQGWIVWMTGRGAAGVRPTRRLTGRQAISAFLLLAALSAGWGHVLARYTDASIPYLDAFIASLSLLAQFLLSSKVLENWLLWITVDVLSVGMYAYKELYGVALLYAVFLAIAAGGWVQWHREYRRQRTASLQVSDAEVGI